MSAIAERVSDPLEVTVGAWVPKSLARELATMAAQSERSVSGEIRYALRKHVAEYRAQEAVAA